MKKIDLLTMLKSLSADDDTVVERVRKLNLPIRIVGNAWDTIPRLNIDSETKLPIDYDYLYHVWNALIDCEDGELEVLLLDCGMNKGMAFYSAFSVDAVLERVAITEQLNMKAYFD